MDWLLQTLINAVLLGGLYTAVAVGMNMIFGIVRLTNLAHGDFLILASYLGLVCSTAFGIHPLVSLLFVMPCMFAIGYGVQRTLINTVIKSSAEAPLLITFGLSIILQNLLQLIFSPDTRSLRTGFSLISLPVSENIRIPLLYLINFLISVLLVVALMLFLKKTYQGQAIIAASENEQIAGLMGIHVNKTYGIAMGIAIMTAGVAGILIGMTYNFYPTAGTQYLIISFGVVVIAGMGSIGGTFAAGMIFAFAQLFGAHFLGIGVQMLAGYFILILMLIFRPQGLVFSGLNRENCPISSGFSTWWERNRNLIRQQKRGAGYGRYV